MGIALYRKYRSRSLDELIGQDHVTTTLRNALSNKSFGHAYLLTGPRGVGKTSIARIFAHAINDLPYISDKTHLDIIEIDAASNRRIDEIRELRDRVHIAPANAKYKIYIIDEAHMLTKEAFNALLKTLEEPPSHAIFILATTEVHKLPDTIISRTQRFTFKPISTSLIARHLQDIAKKEKINIEEDAIKLIAKHGDGSFRDSISLLDQASGLGSKVTLSAVQTMLGDPPSEILLSIFNSIAKSNPKQLIENLGALSDQGYLAAQTAKGIMSLIRDLLIAGNVPNDGVDYKSLMHSLLEVPISPEPDTMLELILLTHLPAVEQTKNNASRPSKPPTNKISQVDEDSLMQDVDQLDVQVNSADTKQDIAIKQAPKSSKVDTSWDKILADLKNRHSTLYSVVRLAKPDINKKAITLYLEFPFHEKRLKEQNNRNILLDIFSKHMGDGVSVTTKLIKVDNQYELATDSNPSVESSSNIGKIFGEYEKL
jgi:DNA polymerase III subunit gamma/tau